MKAVLTTLMFSSVMFLNLSFRKDPDWRKLVPLQSTRADVERLLGPNDKSYGVDYELTDGVPSIEYSSGPCRKERPGGWNVGEGVVISFSFSAKAKQRETDLKLNRKKFRRVIDTHTGGITYYINAVDGIMYEIQQGKVDSVEYYPPKRYKHLYCGEPADAKAVRW